MMLSVLPIFKMLIVLYVVNVINLFVIIFSIFNQQVLDLHTETNTAPQRHR